MTGTMLAKSKDKPNCVKPRVIIIATNVPYTNEYTTHARAAA